MMILIVALACACLALAVMSLYWLFARPEGAVTARLESMDPSLAFVENSSMTVMAERVAEPLNRIVPISAVEAQKLQKQLLQAGYRSQDAAMVYRAIQVTLIVAFPSMVTTASFLLDLRINYLLVFVLLSVAMGFYVPRIILRGKIARRQQRITWALADAL